MIKESKFRLWGLPMPRYEHRGYWESTCVLCWEMRDLCEKDSDDYRYAEVVLNALHAAGFKIFDHKGFGNDIGNRK